MGVINKLLEFILSLFDVLIPTFSLPPSFVTALDSGLTLLITFIEGAAYFIPLDILIICLTAMLIADNFTLLIRVGQFVIKLIRG